MSNSEKEKMEQENIRFLAVETTRTPKKRGAETVMLWDTKSKKPASNTTYEIKKAPKAGSRVKFDTFASEYVGSGDGE